MLQKSEFYGMSKKKKKNVRSHTSPMGQHIISHSK